MNNVLNNVLEFHQTFGHPVANKPTVASEIMEQRISLIFEELEELAYASGKPGHFKAICYKAIFGENASEAIMEDLRKETSNPDIVMMADALVDIEYVWAGTVIATGLKELYPALLEEVHGSNMTKACTNLEEVELAKEWYLENKGLVLEMRKVGDKYVLYREDGKVMKRPTYREANLKQFFDGEKN
jgi:predicted HAD superfamily Cof-like phosphohydrolase